MFVIPSIDILNGKCVQLINGRVETVKVFGDSKRWFRKWIQEGADIIHVIDLDAALGIGSNKDIILELLKNNKVDVQVGGGIRDISYAYDLIQNGAKKIIIGSKALDKSFLTELNKKISKEQIMAALDIADEFIVTDGWKKDTGLKYAQVVNKISSNVGSILSTDVSSEGLLNGPNSKVLYEIKKGIIPTYVSGGFTTIQDIKLAEKIGFSGVIIGRALYEGKLALKELW